MTTDSIPRTYRFLPADILTSSYRVVGKIMVTSTGALGMLNDSTHSSMEVHDGRLARVHMPTKLVDHFDLVRMMKAHIVTVCMARREDLGPQALVRGGYSNMNEYPVHITTQMFEIEGILESPGRFDFTALMTEGTREFIPIFNASLSGTLIPNLRVTSSGLLINRRVIDFIALLTQRVKPQSA